VLLKATKVDGVYDADPNLVPNATRFEQLSFAEAIERDLRVMDITALAMCREQSMPVLVFNFNEPGNIRRVVEGQPLGTYVHNG
jgi:uridylate kinase